MKLARLLVVPLFLIGCHKPTPLIATARDLRAIDLSLTENSTEHLTEAQTVDLLLQTLTDLDLGRSEDCKDWLSTVRLTFDPSQRAEALARAAALCHLRCMPKKDSTTADLAKGCGDDPLVVGPVRKSDRDSLSPTNYVWLRGLVEQTRDALKANGTAHAARLVQQLDELIPRTVKVTLEVQARTPAKP
jgi:hypothetical protein